MIVMIKLTTDAVSLTLTDVESHVLIAALKKYEPGPSIKAAARHDRHDRARREQFQNAADFLRLILTRDA